MRLQLLDPNFVFNTFNGLIQISNCNWDAFILQRDMLLQNIKAINLIQLIRPIQLNISKNDRKDIIILYSRVYYRVMGLLKDAHYIIPHAHYVRTPDQNVTAFNKVNR